MMKSQPSFKAVFRKTLVLKSLRLVAWVRVKRRMLPPPKKRKLFLADLLTKACSRAIFVTLLRLLDAFAVDGVASSASA